MVGACECRVVNFLHGIHTDAIAFFDDQFFDGDSWSSGISHGVLPMFVHGYFTMLGFLQVVVIGNQLGLESAVTLQFLLGQLFALDINELLLFSVHVDPLLV